VPANFKDISNPFGLLLIYDRFGAYIMEEQAGQALDFWYG
jgi:hypothetical protein